MGSPLSDKYGRRYAMLICAAGQSLFSFPLAFMPNWWSFLIIDMLRHGFIQIGYLAASVYVCEIFGPTKRQWAVISSIMFAIGYGFTSLVSWGLPKWNNFMVCLAGISTLYIPICYFIPESPQFLWSIGELDKSEEVLELIATRVGKVYPGGLIRITRVDPQQFAHFLKSRFHLSLLSNLKFMLTLLSPIMSEEFTYCENFVKKISVSKWKLRPKNRGRKCFLRASL